MAINRLNEGTLSAASALPFYDPSNGADRRASMTALAELMAELLPTPGGLVTQYASPSATGFTVTVSPPTAGASMWLLMTPVAGYAAGTIVFPAVATVNDGQEVLVTSTQSVSTVTWTGNGATISGAPAGITGGTPLRFKFDRVSGAWYRVA
jgi:hypothetical protein